MPQITEDNTLILSREDLEQALKYFEEQEDESNVDRLLRIIGNFMDLTEVPREEVDEIELRLDFTKFQY